MAEGQQRGGGEEGGSARGKPCQAVVMESGFVQRALVCGAGAMLQGSCSPCAHLRQGGCPHDKPHVACSCVLKPCLRYCQSAAPLTLSCNLTQPGNLPLCSLGDAPLTPVLVVFTCSCWLRANGQVVRKLSWLSRCSRRYPTCWWVGSWGEEAIMLMNSTCWYKYYMAGIVYFRQATD